MLPGFELKMPGGPKEGFDSKGSTQGAPTLTRGTQGAGARIIPQGRSNINNPNAAGFARWFAGSKVVDG